MNVSWTYAGRLTPIGTARNALIDRVQTWATSSNRMLSRNGGRTPEDLLHKPVEISVAGGGGTLNNAPPGDSPLLEIGFLVEDVDFMEVDRTDPTGCIRRSIMTLDMSCSGPLARCGLFPYYDFLERLTIAQFAPGTQFVAPVHMGSGGSRQIVQRVTIGFDDAIDVRREILGEDTLEVKADDSIFIPSQLRFWYYEGPVDPPVPDPEQKG